MGGLLDAEVEDDVILDMEAGVEHLSRGTSRHVHTLLAVAEPYYRSMETARRIHDLGVELGIPHVAVIANKVRPEDREALREFAAGHAMAVAAEVPYDDAIVEADRRGDCFIDSVPDSSPAAAAIAALADRLLNERD